MELQRVIQIWENICCSPENIVPPVNPSEEAYLLKQELIHKAKGRLITDVVIRSRDDLNHYCEGLRAKLSPVQEESRSIGEKLRAENMANAGKGFTFQSNRTLENRLRTLSEYHHDMYLKLSHAESSFFTPSGIHVVFGSDPHGYFGPGKEIIRNSRVDYEVYKKYGFFILPAAEKFGVDLAIQAHDLVMDVIKKYARPTSLGVVFHLEYVQYVTDAAELISKGQKPNITFVPPLLSDTTNLLIDDEGNDLSSYVNLTIS